MIMKKQFYKNIQKMDYKQKAKQLEKDKRALLKQLRGLQRNIRQYDQTILNRIIEGKNEKLNEYKEIRNKT